MTGVMHAHSKYASRSSPAVILLLSNLNESWTDSSSFSQILCRVVERTGVWSNFSRPSAWAVNKPEVISLVFNIVNF